MVHGLIGIVLRRAAPLKLLNYKLTRRSRMDGLGNSIRDSRISSASIFSASRKVMPSPSRNDRFSPQISRAHQDYFSSILFIYYSPSPNKISFHRQGDEQYYRLEYKRENRVCTRVSRLSIILVLLLAAGTKRIDTFLERSVG